MSVLLCGSGECISESEFFDMDSQAKREFVLKLVRELSTRYNIKYEVEERGVRLDLFDVLRAINSANEKSDLNALSFLLNYSYQDISQSLLYFTYDGDGFLLTEADIKGTKTPTVTERRFNEVTDFIRRFLNENGIKFSMTKWGFTARFKVDHKEMSKSEVYNLLKVFRGLGFREYNRDLYSEKLREKGFVIMYRGRPLLFRLGLTAFTSLKDSVLERHNHHAYLDFFFIALDDQFFLTEISLTFFSFEK